MSVSLWDAIADSFTEQPPDPYLTDPVGWARDKLGAFLWSAQRDIANALVVHRRVAVKASHDVGKSMVAGVLATWWASVHPAGSAFIASTAPSYPQVHAILWEEIRKQHTRGKLAGRVLQSDEWKTDTGTLIGYGRKPSDTDQHGFQGIHREFVLGLIDEACGVAEQLWTAMEAITTNDNCRILAIGNPDDPNTEFGKICKPGSGWHVITINGLESPNFTGEKIPDRIRPLLLSPEWAEDKKRRWGETSPRYVSKVLGEFPDIGEDTLISPKLIEAAQQRVLERDPSRILSVDVARFGSDRSVILLREGPVARVVGDFGGLRTTELTGEVIHAIRTHDADSVRVDVVGVGSGVADQLAEHGLEVGEMQSGAAPLDPEMFLNARAEWWWGLRERFEQGAIDIDPDDDELAAQLGSIKYKYTSRGQVVIESKDDMKKRGLPSPDRADTLMMAYAHIPNWGETRTADELTDSDDYDQETISVY